MYRDKDLQKAANRKASKTYYHTLKAKKIPLSPQGIEDTLPGISPALAMALANPVTLEKIQRIARSLKSHDVLANVRYGCYGITFESIYNVVCV